MASIQPADTVYSGPQSAPPRRVTLRTIRQMYAKNEPLSMVTAYDYPSAVHVSSLPRNVTHLGLTWNPSGQAGAYDVSACLSCAERSCIAARLSCACRCFPPPHSHLSALPPHALRCLCYHRNNLLRLSQSTHACSRCVLLEQVDTAGIDILLVGDSVAMVVHGHDTTLPVTMDDMLVHCKAVSRGARRWMSPPSLLLAIH